MQSRDVAPLKCMLRFTTITVTRRNTTPYQLGAGTPFLTTQISHDWCGRSIILKNNKRLPLTVNVLPTLLQDLMELLEFFPKCLEEASTFRPVVMILDSLDQLPADEGGRRLDWLPGKIPDDCYLIMSTLPGSEYECLPHLKVKNSSSLFS